MTGAPQMIYYPFGPMSRTLISEDEETTERIGTAIAVRLDRGSVVGIGGPLGAGKTVLVRGIAKGLDISEPVCSPSFTLVAEYEGTLPLVHIDLYRTGSSEELELIGIEELLSRDAVIVLEWAEKASGYLPDDSIRIRMEITDRARRIEIDGADIEHPLH